MTYLLLGEKTLEKFKVIHYTCKIYFDLENFGKKFSSDLSFPCSCCFLDLCRDIKLYSIPIE